MKIIQKKLIMNILINKEEKKFQSVVNVNKRV